MVWQFSFAVYLVFLCLLVIPASSFLLQKPRLWRSSVRGSASITEVIPPPKRDTVGIFFDSLQQDSSCIQCSMIGTVNINREQFGIGIPLNTPVLLVKLDELNNTVEVDPKFEFFDLLIDFLSNQLEEYDMMLHKTPLFLTLEGLSDDEDELDDDYDDTGLEEVEMDELARDYSTLLMKKPANNVKSSADDETSDDELLKQSDLSSEILVSESRYLESLMSHAQDVAYVGGFHYRGENYHLLKLTETQILFGKRIISGKGLQFNLLGETDTDQKIRLELAEKVRDYFLGLDKNPKLPNKKVTRSDEAPPSSRRSWMKRKSIGNKE